MATIGSLAVDISATTSAFDRSMQQTTRAMNALAGRQVDVSVGLDSTKALGDIEKLKKTVGSSSAKIRAESAGGTGAAVKYPEVVAPDFVGEIANALLDSAYGFDQAMQKAVDKIIAKLKTATIGNGKGANVFMAVTQGVISYTQKLGESQLAWDAVRDAELRAGKTMEEAVYTADVLQAGSLAKRMGGLKHLSRGYDVLKDRVMQAFTPLKTLDTKKMEGGISALTSKFGSMGQVAGNALTPMLRAVIPMLKVIAVGVGAIGIALGATAVIVAGIYVAWKALAALFSLVQSLLSAVADVFGAIWGLVGELAKSFGEVVGAIYEIGAAIVAQVYAPFDYVFGKIGDMWTSVYDTIMSGFSKVKGFITGALMAATLAWLGKIAWDSGAFGAGLGGLAKMLRGGKERVERRDASGEVIAEGGFLQDIVDRSSASIKKFFDTIQIMVGSFFKGGIAGIPSIVQIAADKVSAAIEWITSNLKTWISKAITATIAIVKVVDSGIGMFLALFHGDWSGAAAMGLEVAAKMSDGLAMLVQMVAPAIDWIVDKTVESFGWIVEKVGGIAGALVEVMAKGFAQIESPIREALAAIVNMAATVTDTTLKIARVIETGMKIIEIPIREMMFAFENPMQKAMETLNPITGTVNYIARAAAVMNRESLFAGSEGTGDKMRGVAAQLTATQGDTSWADSAAEMGAALKESSEKFGKEMQDKGSSGLKTGEWMADGLAKLSEAARGKAAELDPKAQDKYGGTTDPLIRALEKFQKQLGSGNVVDPLGKIIDKDAENAKSGEGGVSTLSVDTALGQVKLAGSFDKGAMVAKNALTEAQKQTQILQKMQDLLANTGAAGENFVAVKDIVTGDMMSVSKLLTHMVTRQDVLDPTKTTTAPELLIGKELEKRMADLALIAENMKGGDRDLSGVDYEGIIASDPTFLSRAVAEASAIPQATKNAFRNGGDQESHKLISETNAILKKMSNNKTSNPFT